MPADLPSDWRLLTLGDVAQWSSGGTPKRTNPRYFGGSIPWVVIGDLNDGLVTNSSTYITEEGLRASSAKWVPPDAVLLAMYGSIGKLGIAGTTLTTNQAIAHAIANDEIVEAKYLFWYLRSIRRELITEGKGGTQQNISQTIIKGLPIPVPPLDAQRRIVAAIEQQITRLESGTALTAGVRRRLGDLRRAILLAATSRRASRQDWQSLTVGDVADPSRPICYGILKPRTAAPGTVPYVEVRDLREPVLRPESLKRTTKDLHEAFPRSVLRAGDVLVAVRGSYDRVGIVPRDLEGANISRDVARVSPGEGVEPRYLMLWLRAPVAQRYFRRVARGVAVKGVNIGDLRKTPIDLPPLAEQSEIVQQVESQLSIVDALESELNESSMRSELLRQSILAAGFTGALSSKEAPVG